MIKCKQGIGECGKDMCCKSCEDKGTCDQVCESVDTDCEHAYEGEFGIEVFKSQAAAIIKSISDIVTAKKALEDQEKTMKEKLQQAMEQYGVKSFDAGAVKMTYIEASTRNSIDSAKLKKNHPDIAAECAKSSPVKAYVKVEVK